MLILTSFYGGLLVALYAFLIVFVIHTYVMYSYTSNNMYNNLNDTRANCSSNGTYAQDHGPNAITMNQFLLIVAGLQHCISCITKLVPYVVTFVVWMVASYVINQIESNNMSTWCHDTLVGFPIVLVSSYVLYQIGGCLRLVLSCCN